MEDDAFLDAIRQLPFVPVHEIETTASRDQFAALKVPGAQTEDFDAAWRALHRKFRLAAAASDELHRLLDLSLAEHQDDRLSKIEDHLREIKEHFTATPRDDAPEIAAYRERLYRRYVYADTRGLFMREKEGAGEGIRLQDVFVETPLERTVETLRTKREDQDDKEAASDEERDEARVETRKETSPVGQVLSRERLTVVLGAPGSGKSTLLRCLAMALCRPGEGILDLGTLDSEVVPVLFELKIFASVLRQEPHSRLDHVLIEQVRKDLPSIEKLLDDGKALVLLDGLDEVFDEDDRRWVSDLVWYLVTRYPRSRFVLTSRPHGYRAAPLPGPVARWRLLEFDNDAIRRFFRGWFEALAREGAEAGARQSPRERADALTEDVLGRPRIRKMAENPMLCTLIVLVHRSRSGHLPERRVVFYEAAVKTLVESWERYKHSPRGVAEGYDFPEPELMIHALAEVAWRTFHELGRREIPGEKLRQWLRESLTDFPEWTGKRRRKAVDDFLQVVQDRTGLLLGLGGDRFQFVHLSLHEYLVAFYVLDRFDEAMACSVVRHYLHAPQWEEALRLTVAGAGHAKATKVVQAVLAEPTSGYEDRLCRDLRFVCRCLGDKASIAPEARDDVHGRLVTALDGNALDLTGLAEDAARIGPGRVAEAMRNRLEDEDYSVRRAAVEYFARVGGVDESMRLAVEKRLSDESWSVRRAAVEYFARVGGGDKSTRLAVEKRLSDESGSVRRSAVEYFSRVGGEDESTRLAIKERLSDQDYSVRLAAVEYFAHVGGEEESTRVAVEKRLSDEDYRVRLAAVEYFVQVGGEEESTRLAVEKRLSDEDYSVRRVAVEYFSRVGGKDESTRLAFEKRLSDESWSVRLAAVEYFSRVGGEDESTRLAFEKRLSDESLSVRLAAVEYFARVGGEDESTRLAFEKRLSSEDYRVRLAAVEYFSRVGGEGESTRFAFEKRLSDEDYSVRRAAVEYFARMGISTDVADRAFRTFAQVDGASTSDLDRAFSAAFGKVAPSRPELMNVLLEEGPKTKYFRMDAALSAAALELDRRHREKEPLVLG